MLGSLARIGASAATALLLTCGTALAMSKNHDPPGSTVVSYDGTLSPGIAATGAIGFSSPVDGYDWYCFRSVAGQQVTLTVTRTSGDIFPNVAAFLGNAQSGQTVSAAGLVEVAGTDNGGSTQAATSFVPSTATTYTVVVSTFLAEAGGNYSLVMTGGVATTCGTATSGPRVLTFEGLANNEQVANFYGGGTGGSGSSGGSNFGITFNPTSLALVDSDAGGTGTIGGEPSPDTVLFFQFESLDLPYMNVAGGFTGAISFYYSAISATQIITLQVYSGPNATGTLLQSVALPTTANTGAPDPTGIYSPLVPFGTTFSGLAQSVAFAGGHDFIVIDNITLGQSVPVNGTPGVAPPTIPPPVSVQQLTAPAPASNDLTGSGVAVSDNVMAVGVPGRNGSEGVVLVFNRSGSTFVPAASAAKTPGLDVGPSQEASAASVLELPNGLELLATSPGGEWGTAPAAILSAGDPAGKDGRSGKLIGDKFGAATAVSPDGATIVVGLPGANSGGGKVRVFRRVGDTWAGTLTGGVELSPTQSVNVSNPRSFGESVDIDARGNIVVGAPDSTVNGMAEAGAAYVFDDQGGTNIPVVGAPLTASQPQAGADFGDAVAVDEGLLAVGAPRQDGAEVDSGAAYVFPPLVEGGGTGVAAPVVVTCQGSGGLGDKAQCGDSVDVDNGNVVVGAPGLDDPDTGEQDTGGAEVFRRGTLTFEFNPTASLRPGAGSDQAAGSSVSIEANVVAMGAPQADGTQADQGKTYVYGMPEAGFTPGSDAMPDLTLGNSASSAGQFGSALDMSPRNIAVGAPTATITAIANAGRSDSFVFDRVGQSSFEGPSEDYAVRDNTTPSCRYSYIDPSTHTVLPFDFADDGRALAAQPLGPTGFNFFGQQVSSVVMSTNGYLSTNVNDSGGNFTNSCIPDAVDNRLYVLHDDLFANTSASLRRAYFPVCPRAGDLGTALGCTVFSWVDMSRCCSDASHAEFQAILYDGSFEIVYQYKTPELQGGASATVGIRLSETRQAQYSCNEAREPAGRAVCLFHPRYPPR